ncbi:hypothetical protein RvY_02024-2 [Ramazzottius varieornatus]|uniref:Uncharacterized protein n=1 Tax=Ramazzottius varieornatus TaxID=947166 RepID=A0A1D1UIE0_RAMVA|nr:hypothetical protein RvY_02024-2 [Ramazzottius varieornatus]
MCHTAALPFHHGPAPGDQLQLARRAVEALDPGRAYSNRGGGGRRGPHHVPCNPGVDRRGRGLTRNTGAGRREGALQEVARHEVGLQEVVANFLLIFPFLFHWSRVRYCHLSCLFFPGTFSLQVIFLLMNGLPVDTVRMKHHRGEQKVGKLENMDEHFVRKW